LEGAEWPLEVHVEDVFTYFAELKHDVLGAVFHERELEVLDAGLQHPPPEIQNVPVDFLILVGVFVFQHEHAFLGVVALATEDAFLGIDRLEADALSVLGLRKADAHLAGHAFVARVLLVDHAAQLLAHLLHVAAGLGRLAAAVVKVLVATEVGAQFAHVALVFLLDVFVHAEVLVVGRGVHLLGGHEEGVVVGEREFEGGALEETFDPFERALDQGVALHRVHELLLLVDVLLRDVADQVVLGDHGRVQLRAFI